MGPTLRTVSRQDGPAFISAVRDRVAVAGDYVYVADGYAGLGVYRLGRNESVELIGSYETGEYATGVRLKGAHAYVFDTRNGQVAYDIREPKALRQLSAAETMGAALADGSDRQAPDANYVAALVDDRIYIARADLGVAVIETRSPKGLPPPPFRKVIVYSPTGADLLKTEGIELRTAVISRISKAEPEPDVPVSEDKASPESLLVTPTAGLAAPQPALIPAAPLVLTLTASWEDGAVKLQISGPSGQAIRLQRSSNMAGAWEDWKTITLGDAPSEVLEAEPSGASHVFYRAVTP
jgi:hypothetical protein